VVYNADDYLYLISLEVMTCATDPTDAIVFKINSTQDCKMGLCTGFSLKEPLRFHLVLVWTRRYSCIDVVVSRIHPQYLCKTSEEMKGVCFGQRGEEMAAEEAMEGFVAYCNICRRELKLSIKRLLIE
jgi:hypothetical protein